MDFLANDLSFEVNKKGLLTVNGEVINKNNKEYYETIISRLDEIKNNIRIQRELEDDISIKDIHHQAVNEVENLIYKIESLKWEFIQG